MPSAIVMFLVAAALLTAGYQAQIKISEQKIPVGLTQFASSVLYLIGFATLSVAVLLSIVLLYQLSVPSVGVTITAIYTAPVLLTLATAFGVEVKRSGDTPYMLSVIGGIITAYGLIGIVLSFTHH